MDLILSVLADPQGANMLKHTKLFSSAGGSLGRADGNDWVLPDPERVVSSRHAQVSFRDNQYFLADNSTNGTYHNRAEDPIGKGNEIPLNDGDVIAMGDYQLKVSLRQPQQQQGDGLPKGLGDADFLDGADRTTFSPAAAAKMQNRDEAQQLDSWLEPGAATNNGNTGEWGYLTNNSLTDDGLANSDSGLGVQSGGSLLSGSDPVDPLAAFSHSGNSGFADSQDPLASFGNAGAQNIGGGQWDDDDWWKDGSEQDSAPAHSHSMQVNLQPAPEPVEEAPAQPSFEQPAPSPVPDFLDPAAQPQQAPIPPVQPQVQPQAQTAPQAEPDNPFAESFAVMQGQQVAGAPGFDSGAPVVNNGVPGVESAASPAPGFPDASQNFAPLQQPPAQPQQPPSQPQAQPLTPQAQPLTSQVQPQAMPQQPAPSAPPPQAPVPPAQPQAPAVGGGVLAAALGLNLTPAQQQQLDQQAAGIVQETVARLIDLLRARSSIKNELRVQRTMIQTEANNPLKFSATANDALNAMFAGTGAFMEPKQAVRDSFDDLSDHQVAVLAGMRAGYDAMLKYFSPENVERRLNSQGGVFASKNARNWEGFVEMYRDLAKDPEACYRRLFGDEFAATYEHQLSELKNARNL